MARKRSHYGCRIKWYDVASGKSVKAATVRKLYSRKPGRTYDEIRDWACLMNTARIGRLVGIRSGTKEAKNKSKVLAEARRRQRAERRPVKIREI